MVENESMASNEPGAEEQPNSLGDEILALLEKKCKNPGQAFVILQQMVIFVWDQYKIDWSQGEGMGTTRKQRYMDYVNNLIDTLQNNNALVQKID